MFKKILILGAASLFLAGCSHTGSSGTTGGTAQPTEAASGTQGDIETENFAFSPNPLTVKAGESFTYCNRDVAGHTLTADDGTSFDTPVVGKDECQTVTAPSTPGDYPFHCTPHPSMKGTLTVQ